MVCAFVVLSIVSFPIAISIHTLAVGHVDFFGFQHAIRFCLCLNLFAQAFLGDISKTSVGIYSCDEFTQIFGPAITLRHRPQDK